MKWVVPAAGQVSSGDSRLEALRLSNIVVFVQGITVGQMNAMTGTV